VAAVIVAVALPVGVLAAPKLAVAAAEQTGTGRGVAAAAIEPDIPWAMHTITSGPRGADGTDLADVNGDGLADVTSGWEEGGLVTVSLHPERGAEAGPWPTVDVATRLYGVEDAVFADVDQDGHMDVVTACECRKVVIYFGPERSRILDPAAWTPVTISVSGPVPQRWIKVAVADIDGDQDTDVLLSDKTSMRFPDGTIRYDLRGTRWLENHDQGASWTSHPIGFASGEHQFFDVVDFDRDGTDDVVDAATVRDGNAITFRRNLGDWLGWEPTSIQVPAGVGQIQDVQAADVDLDGDLDLALSFSHADGDLSGVVWLEAGPDGTWTRGEVSGPAGTKYDNVSLEDVDADGDLDVMTSEEIEQLGVVWYENPAR